MQLQISLPAKFSLFLPLRAKGGVDRTDILRSVSAPGTGLRGPRAAPARPGGAAHPGGGGVDRGDDGGRASRGSNNRQRNSAT